MIAGPFYLREDGSLVATVDGYPYHILKTDPLFGRAQELISENPALIETEPEPAKAKPDADAQIRGEILNEFIEAQMNLPKWIARRDEIETEGG